MKRYIEFSTRLVLLAGLMGLSSQALSAPSFTSIDANDMVALTKEFSAGNSLHTLTRAAPMGAVFGFEFGLIGGVAQTPQIDSLVKRASPSSSLPNFPHTGITAGLSIPLGITFEGTYIPQITSADGNYQQYGLALKYSSTFAALINVAIRGFLTSTQFSFTQVISSVNNTVKFDNSVNGFQLLLSPAYLPIIEPYVGIGMINGKGTLSVTGSATIFNTSYTAQQTADAAQSSVQMIAGVGLKLTPLVLGVEYARLFDTNTFTGKLAFGF
jgi:hypothetical protein